MTELIKGKTYTFCPHHLEGITFDCDECAKERKDKPLYYVVEISEDTVTCDINIQSTLEN